MRRDGKNAAKLECQAVVKADIQLIFMFRTHADKVLRGVVCKHQRVDYAFMIACIINTPAQRT